MLRRRGGLPAAALLLALPLLFSRHASGMIHNLEITQDPRRVFRIESFGFEEGGVINITVSDFTVYAKPPFRVGFVMRRSLSETASQQDLEGVLERDECLLDVAAPPDVVLDLSDPKATWVRTSYSSVVGAGDKGLYSLVFCRCTPGDPASVSFRLKAVFHNPGPDFLSAGETALPRVFLGFFVVFLVALIAWVWLLRRRPAAVHHVHHMMAVLLVFKTLAMLFESVRYHYLKVSGAAEAWSIVYYVFAFLKGTMLFVVILLIGSGWSLVKPYLNDREKRIIVAVLTLQVIDNIAMVVIEEMAPGSQGWLTWRDILHALDILCCAAILFPIVWSIRHLRQAVAADGKAEHTIRKLNLFRSFYLLVFSYIYFTRVVVFLLAVTLPFELTWLQSLVTEAATAIFYVMTGWKFRPESDNPWLPVDRDDRDLEDFDDDSFANEESDLLPGEGKDQREHNREQQREQQRDRDRDRRRHGDSGDAEGLGIGMGAGVELSSRDSRTVL